ncbi:MAG: DUF4388 domain-containing protein [Deltaproteobacteria bacterium]|nr:DUF4388 domain-containing protein [Candidatus Zymogenaceae bacterium]
MALQGDIKDLSVVDILQLLYQQQKSGVLTLADKSKQVQVLFDNGMIISATSSIRNINEYLGEMLLKADLITKTQLLRTLEIQRETLKKLGDILIEQGYITLEELRHFLKLQTHETIFKLLMWKSGTYNFHQRIVTYNKKTTSPINTEHFLMDSLRMTDELPEIRKKVYSKNIVFEKMPGAEDEIKFWRVQDRDEDEDDLFFDSDEPDPSERILNSSEKRIFDLIDGERSVSEIINIGRIGEFETLKALSMLISKRLIDVGYELEEERITTSQDISVKNVSSYLAVAVFVIILVGYLFIAYPRIKSNFTISPSNTTLFNQSQLNMERANIESAIEIYYFIHSSYPENLQQLYTNGYVENVRYDWKDRFEYTLTGSGYSLIVKE